MKAADRKAIYKFYRDRGYSRAEAMKMRNRPRKVWQDYFKEVTETRKERNALPRYSTNRPTLPKAPKVSVNRKTVMAQLKRVGLPAKVRSQFNRLSDKALMQKSLNIQKAISNFEVYTSYFGIKKDYRDRFEDVANIHDFYKALGEVSGLVRTIKEDEEDEAEDA